MTNLWKGLIGAGLFAAIVLYINFSDKEEIKHEMRIEKLEQKLEETRFDDDFEDAWNGTPSATRRQERKHNLAELQNKIDRAQEKLDGLDAFDDEFIQGGQQALKEEDARLSEKPKQAINNQENSNE